MTDSKLMTRAADNIRILAASMVEKAKSGHPGGAMGGADFVNVLFSKYLVTDPDNPAWFARDRFFLDPGHMSPMLYSVLHLAGRYTTDDIKAFRSWGSITPGHPELDVEHGVENTSGPLGQGHVMAIGAAIAERFIATHYSEVFAHKTYAFISDGGVQEGISQEAARIAGYLGLNNLIMFYDSNTVQLSTDCDAVSNEDTAMKYRAWNWNVIECDGTDPAALAKALDKALDEKQRPTIIIGRTIMGRGCVTAEGENFEGKCSTHGNPLSKSGADYAKTIENLGGNPENPWVVFPEVAELYAQRAEEQRKLVAQRKQEIDAWAQQNPEAMQRLQNYIDGKAPEVDYAAIEHKPGIATRAASANVLATLAKEVENMIVSSADLANSDKTDGYLKVRGAFKTHDFQGAFLHAGVSELAMAAIINGMALHGGVIAACGTFFVFSDYIKPAARLSALMELPVKFIWTHDAFRVGEDGPTHEPVEQEAQIRLMEKLKNHHGKNSVLVMRPADAKETTEAWAAAMDNMNTPTALILSRQNIANLPEGNDYSQVAKGGYIVAGSDANPDVILVASGSEVSTLEAGAKLLREAGKKVRVVSVPSEGLFRQQSKEYQQTVLPTGVKKFGMTAGLPVTLQGLVPEAEGTVWGLESFGFSAPYKVLDEKLGYTAENVFEQVNKLF